MAKRGKMQTNGPAAATPRLKRSYLKQADVPKHSLEHAIRLPQTLLDDFAGKPTAPHQIAIALDLAVTGQAWEDLSGSSSAYGMTEGGSHAASISLTDLGRSIVAPTEEGQDVTAKSEAAIATVEEGLPDPTPESDPAALQETSTDVPRDDEGEGDACDGRDGVSHPRSRTEQRPDTSLEPPPIASDHAALDEDEGEA